MNDPAIVLQALGDIIYEAGQGDPSLSERCSFYAAARILIDDLKQHIDRDLHGDGYAREKAYGVGWHLGAALGFDTTNGHSAADHRSWALGELSSLTSKLRELSGTPAEN